MAETTAIYCALTPEEQRARLSEVRATIVPQVAALTSIDNGLQFDFASNEGLRELVEEFIALEQDCCSFLIFTISEPADDLSLQIQGPPAASHIIEMFRRTIEGEDH